MFPINPISSENAAKTKSLCASGMNQNFCNHFPYHFPRNPHPPIANNACWFCHPICLAWGSTLELMKYVNLFWIYANLSLIIPAIPPSKSQLINHQNIIHITCFALAPAYRHMTSPTIARIITVQRSGINRNTKKNIASRIINEMKKSLVFILSRFLINHHPKKSTYHSLKNSAGWILGNIGISIHHLAPLYVAPIPGIKTAICNIISTIATMVTDLCFWKNFIGTAYIALAATRAKTMFLSCLKK